MTYEKFLDFVTTKCMYETIYDDSEGRTILVIALLNAYGMVNRAQRPWVGLTGQEKELIASVSLDVHDAVHRTDAKLKEKNA